MTAAPSNRLLLQRLRNRIMDALELAACEETQRAYQRDVPYVDVPYQIINRWNDFVGDDWHRYYVAGEVFTSAEIEAIAAFHAVHAEVSEQIEDLPLDALISTVAWQRLLTAGTEALTVFLCCGHLPEDDDNDAEQHLD